MSLDERSACFSFGSFPWLDGGQYAVMQMAHRVLAALKVADAEGRRRKALRGA